MAQDFLKELISPGQKSNISFEESLLWKYSELARLSYKDGDIPGYEELVVDEHDRIIGKRDGQEVWLGFRGSGADSAHWLGKTGNLHALPNNDSICRGFANALQEFHDGLKSWCQGSRIIHLTGHSRGGAFATLGGWLLANDFRDAEVNVVVFGCPRVGTSTFAEKFRNRKNLRWAGFQHAGDHVGKLPPWGEHIHPPADPLTDFQAGSWPLLQRIPKVGNALNIMWVFGSNLMKNHSMESYHQSLKCNFILRTGAPDVDEIIRTITNRQQKAMLTIGVQAVKANARQIQEQVRQAADELKELLSADRLKGVLSAALAEEFVIQMKGATRFLANMYATDLEGMKLNVHDLEKKLHDLVERLPHVPQDSTEMLKLLLEAFFKAGFVLAMCRMKLGDTPHDLKERFAGLGEDVKAHLWRLAHDLQNADAFYAALPSLVQVEAACAVHLDNREPLFVTDEIQDQFLPHHIRPTKIQQDMRKLKKEFRSQVASARPGGVAKLLSSKGLGENLVRLLEAILKDVASDSKDERLKPCHEEVMILKQRMDDLMLPEVVLTGPTNAGKGPLTNAFLGQEVVSTTAVPDSFRILPTRFIPQEEGVSKTFQVEFRGTGLSDQPGLFKDKLDTALKETLEAKEVNTAEEVQETIKKINKRFRKFLDSETFRQNFSDEEKRVLSQHLCFDWSVDIKIPTCSHGALPVILVDLPGSTEDGFIGDFIKTMVRGSCSRASTALLVLSSDMVIEHDRKGTDLVHRFFGGVSDFSGYYIVITKVFGKKTVDQWNPRVCQKAAQLKPEPLGIRFIDSYLLRAHVASRAGPLPERFPSVEVDASDEEKRRCEAEKKRCQIIFDGVENKHMKVEDPKKFKGKDLEKDLKEKLDEFPETAGFTSELCSLVVLGPHLKRMQRHIQGVVDEIHQRVEICLGRETEVDAYFKLLCNLDVEFMELLKKKAWLKVQGKIEQMAAFDSPGWCYNDVDETFDPGVADWCHRNEHLKSNHHDLVMRESTKVYVEILHQQLAEQFGWAGEIGIPDFASGSLSQKLEIPGVSKQLAAAMTTLGVAGAGALSVASRGPLAQTFFLCSVGLGSYAGPRLFNLAIAETPDQRLASLKECADLNLSRLNDSVKKWLQTKLEGRLTMLVEENSDLPHLEKKLQQYLKVCDHLQEIQKVVKDS